LDVSTIEFPLIAISPAAPEVLETRLSRDPDESVSTLAVTPAPDALMAEASPASVLLEELRVMVWAVPLPALIVIEPDNVSFTFVIAVKYPLEVCARFDTVTACVPAIADGVAAVNVRTFWSELDPSFSASTP
jgi:hypothetical protein